MQGKAHLFLSLVRNVSAATVINLFSLCTISGQIAFGWHCFCKDVVRCSTVVLTGPSEPLKKKMHQQTVKKNKMKFYLWLIWLTRSLIWRHFIFLVIGPAQKIPRPAGLSPWNQKGRDRDTGRLMLEVSRDFCVCCKEQLTNSSSSFFPLLLTNLGVFLLWCLRSVGFTEAISCSKTSSQNSPPVNYPAFFNPTPLFITPSKKIRLSMCLLFLIWTCNYFLFLSFF